MNKRQQKKAECKVEWLYYHSYSYNEIRKRCRKYHENNVAVNQKAKLLILKQKQHTSMAEDLLIGAYIPPKYRWRTILKAHKHLSRLMIE